jgi:type IV pilus assembly protein PilV
MRHISQSGRPQTGFAIIEVLVTLLVLLIGLLGLAGLLLQSQRHEVETYQRAQALIVLQDIVERIKANRKAASCYVVTTDTATGSPYLGSGGSVTSTCTAGVSEKDDRALLDIAEWNNLLLGSTELASSTNSSKVGGLINARGCVSFDATTKLYTATVAWQGLGASAAPGSGTNCGKGNYADGTATDNDTLRRVVTVTLRIGDLSA